MGNSSGLFRFCCLTQQTLEFGYHFTVTLRVSPKIESGNGPNAVLSEINENARKRTPRKNRRSINIVPFSIFKPKCPVSIYDQANIEYDMQWLVERIGYEKVLQAVPFSSEQMGIKSIGQSRASALSQRDTVEDLKSTAKLMNVVVDGYSV